MRHMRKALVELFWVWDMTPENRTSYLREDNPKLAAYFTLVEFIRLWAEPLFG